MWEVWRSANMFTVEKRFLLQVHLVNFLGNVLFQPLNPGGIYEGKIRKNCIPKMEGGNVHLPMIKKHGRSRCFAPPLWRPGCESVVVPEPWFWVIQRNRMRPCRGQGWLNGGPPVRAGDWGLDWHFTLLYTTGSWFIFFYRILIWKRNRLPVFIFWSRSWSRLKTWSGSTRIRILFFDQILIFYSNRIPNGNGIIS